MNKTQNEFHEATSMTTSRKLRNRNMLIIWFQADEISGYYYLIWPVQVIFVLARHIVSFPNH